MKKIKNIVLEMDIFRRPSVSYCAKNLALPDVFVKTSADQLREIFLLPKSPYKTQLNQDLFALIVNRFKPSYFIEIGANDGYTLSNTVYLEEQFGWTGILVEANPDYERMLMNRKSKSVIAAVVEKEGQYEFCSAGLYGGLADTLDNTHEEKTRSGNTITVWGATLEQILENNDAPPQIHFISIDVEGGEISIVKQMCKLSNYRFTCGCIEHNARREDQEQITRLLTENGYHIVWEGQTQHDLFFVDTERLMGSAN